jgi:hypothetical protein
VDVGSRKENASKQESKAGSDSIRTEKALAVIPGHRAAMNPESGDCPVLSYCEIPGLALRAIPE